MDYRSIAAMFIALIAVSFAAPRLASLGHRNSVLSTVSSSSPLDMNSLSAEEINERTLRLAATVTLPAK